MKRAMILLVITGTVLAYTGAAFADSQTVVLTDSFGHLRTAERGIHKNAWGYVTLTQTEDGGMDVTIQLYKAAKSYTYLVTSNSILRGTFTTNRQGVGGLQFHAPATNPLGQYMSIWTSDRTINLLHIDNPFWVPPS